jgi:hypothetical protein
MSRTLSMVGCAVLLALALAPRAEADSVLARVGAEDPVVAGDTVFFSKRDASRRWRLMAWREGAMRTVRVRGEPFVFAASPGSDRRGSPVLTYVRCPRRRCTEVYELRIRDSRERRLAIASGRGCELSAPTMRRGTLLFLRRGSCASRGVWLRAADGLLRRLSRDDEACCTALVGDAAAWIGSRGSNRVFLRVAPHSGRRFDVYVSEPAVSSASGSLLAHEGMLYWGVTMETRAGALPRPFEARIYRASPVAGASCEATDRTFPSLSRSTASGSDLSPPAFAIGSAGIVYGTRTELRLADAPPPPFSVASTFKPQSTRPGPGCRL